MPLYSDDRRPGSCTSILGACCRPCWIYLSKGPDGSPCRPDSHQDGRKTSKPAAESIKTMKSFFRPFICAAVLLLTAGCVTDNGKFPTPAADFTPKRTYAVSHDKLWQATLDALDNNHIAVMNSDKADGRIQTDYVSGP